MLNTVLPVPFAQLGAGGPCLIAVHEELFLACHRPRQRSNSILQHPGGQLCPQADGTAARGDGCRAVKNGRCLLRHTTASQPFWVPSL